MTNTFNKSLMEEKKYHSYRALQNRNDRENHFLKKIQILTCKLNESEDEMTKQSNVAKFITEEKNKYKCYVELIMKNMKEIKEGKINIDSCKKCCVRDMECHVDQMSVDTQCSCINKLSSKTSIENNLQRYADNLMYLIDVCGYYELMLEKFEKTVINISNHSKSLYSIQLNQEQELKKKDFDMSKMKTDINNMQYKIDMIQKDKDIVETQFERLNDELYCKNMEYESNKLKLENKICGMKKEIKEVINICDEKCEKLIGQNLKLENDLTAEKDNKLYNINKITKYVLNLKPMIKCLEEQIKKSEGENSELNAKICFMEQDLKKKLNDFNLVTSELCCAQEDLKITKKENHCMNNITKLLESKIEGTDKKLQFQICQNEELLRKLKSMECANEMTKNLLSTKIIEHDKLLAENDRLSFDNCTFCKIIDDLKENAQKLKSENNCLKESKKGIEKTTSTYEGIETNPCSVECCQSTNFLKNVEYQRCACGSDQRNDFNNERCIDQCNCNDSYCSFSVQTKTTNKCDCNAEKEYLQKEMDRMKKLFEVKETVAQKEYADIERKYYNMEKEMNKILAEKKEEYEYKLEELNTQIDMYEKAYLLNEKNLDTYKMQEIQLKKVISDQKSYIENIEIRLKLEENKVVSLVSNLNSYKNKIENVRKSLTSEKSKNIESEDKLKALTDILTLIVNKAEYQSKKQQEMQQQEEVDILKKQKKMSNGENSRNIMSPKKQRKMKCMKNDQVTDEMADYSRTKMTELPQLKCGRLLIEDHNKNNIHQKSVGGEMTDILNISGQGYQQKLIKKLGEDLATALQEQ